MAKSESIPKMIANQMMRGPRPAKLKATKEQQEEFFNTHKDKILLISSYLPTYYSAAVGAVLTKCYIKYGEKPTLELCYKLQNHNFNGEYCPVFQLWKYLNANKSKRKLTVEVYQKTLGCVKCYFEGEELNQKYLRPLNLDVFEWGPGYSIPENIKNSLNNR